MQNSPVRAWERFPWESFKLRAGEFCITKILWNFRLRFLRKPPVNARRFAGAASCGYASDCSSFAKMSGAPSLITSTISPPGSVRSKAFEAISY